MLRKEACSGQIEDLAHVVSVDGLSYCLTKSSAKADALVKAVSTSIIKNIDMHPPFRSLLTHKAFLHNGFISFLAVDRTESKGRSNETNLDQNDSGILDVEVEPEINGSSASASE